MPTHPLYYTLLRGVLLEEGSEERVRERERQRRFLTSEDMRLHKFYTKVYHGRKMQACCVSHKCEREGTSFVHASTDQKRSA